MGELRVSNVKGLASADLTLGEASQNVSAANTLSVTGILTATGGITLAGDMTGNSTGKAGTGTSKLAEVNAIAVNATNVDASGSVDGSTVTADAEMTCGTAQIGSGATATTGCATVRNQLKVDNNDGNATAVTVLTGNVNCGTGQLICETFKIGGVDGTAYTETDFAGFGSGGSTGTNYVKAFGKIPYDFNIADHNPAVSGGLNVNSAAQDTSEFTIQINFSATISDPIITFSSTQDGDDGDSSKPLTWYVSNESSGSITLKLRNGETNDNGDLYFQVVDA